VKQVIFKGVAIAFDIFVLVWLQSKLFKIINTVYSKLNKSENSIPNGIVNC
jgi:hypothetical protein